MTNIFFTADTHFDHANIIKWANRPFDSLEQMNNILLDNWNKTVKPHDIVYFLGDMAFGTQHWIPRLNGNIIFIMGNHDSKSKKYYNYPNLIRTEHLINKKIHSQRITMCHYPLASWDKWRGGAWCLHGHSHGRYKKADQLILDVGVDCHKFFPLHFEQVEAIMEKKKESLRYRLAKIIKIYKGIIK